MRIIGIDPGTARTGFGIIEIVKGEWKALDFGCITTKKTEKMEHRLQQMSDDITSLIRLWKPEKGAVEEIFFSKNVKTAISVAQARGVILKTLSQEHVEIHEYKPNQVKNSVCGDGRADKTQVQKMVKMLLNLDHIPHPDDAADALAIALCGAMNQHAFLQS